MTPHFAFVVSPAVLACAVFATVAMAPGVGAQTDNPDPNQPTFPPAVQTLIAGGTPPASAPGVVFSLTYQLIFNDGSALNGQLTDRVTGQYALSCGDVGAHGHRSLVGLGNEFLMPGGLNLDSDVPVNVGLAAVPCSRSTPLDPAPSCSRVFGRISTPRSSSPTAPPWRGH